MYKTEEN